jgi:hypothetical protein
MSWITCRHSCFWGYEITQPAFLRLQRQFQHVRLKIYRHNTLEPIFLSLHVASSATHLCARYKYLVYLQRESHNKCVNVLESAWSISESHLFYFDKTSCLWSCYWLRKFHIDASWLYERVQAFQLTSNVCTHVHTHIYMYGWLRARMWYIFVHT